jgi:predicted  nucleic acid-binding Zn-ribbon protein
MPSFGNVLLPELTTDQMRGVWALLELISTPKSQEAQDFMHQLVQVKDEAVKAQAKAAEDRAAVEAINKSLAAREATVQALQQAAETQAAEARALKAQLDTKHAKYMQIFGSR